MAGNGMNMGTHRFWESDGVLRATNNRLLAMLFLVGAVAIVTGAVAIVKTIQPPTVIRVSSDGSAQVISPKGDIASSLNPALNGRIKTAQAPTATECDGYVRRFLNTYLTYDAHTIEKSWSDALNMTTRNLSESILATLKEKDTVTKFENDQVRSQFTFVSEAPGKDPLTYTIYGKREVHSVDRLVETSKVFVEVYTVRLVTIERTVRNPEGLLIADFAVKQLSGTDDLPLTGAVPQSTTTSPTTP